MRSKFSLIRCVIVAFITILHSVSFGQSVAMFKYDPALTGVSDEKPVYKLDGIKFSYVTHGAIRSTPAIANGLAYFGSGDGYFYAIDGKSGAERWRFKTGGAVHSSPAVTASTAYFTSRDGNLYAVNALTGKLLWKYAFGKDLIGDENYWDNYGASPVIAKTTLYLGTGSGYLFAFNTSTHKLLWKYNAGARIKTAAAISGNHVVFGANSGYVISVDKATGKLQWQFASDGVKNTFERGNNDRKSIFCNPSIADGVVITGGRDGIVYAIDLETGKEKWRNDHKGPWILGAAIKNKTAYIACGSDYLVQALDLNTGAEKWKFKVPSAIFSSISIAGDMLYFTDVDVSGNLHAVDAATGTEKWCFPIGIKSFCTPVVKDGIVYCGGENGVLYALQGNMSASSSVNEVQKAVYWQEKNKKDYDYFAPGVDQYLKAYFVRLGYKLLDAAGLQQFMQDQSAKKAASVVVFADNKFPDIILKAPSGAPLIRQYLDAGGKVVIFSTNPSSYARDSTGIVIGFDDDIPSKIFNITYAPKKNVRGLYINTATKTGNKYGLSGFWTSSSGASVVVPDKSTEVLATDEFGSATEWLKNYGGPKGSGLLQLSILPNEVPVNLSQIRAVIECGISW